MRLCEFMGKQLIVCSMKAVFSQHTDDQWQGTLADDLRKQRNLVGMRVGKTFSFAFICLRTHTHTNTPVRSALKRTPVPVSRKGWLRCHTENLAAELFSSSALSPDLCSACRGVLLKGLSCSEEKKPSKIQSQRWYLKSLLPIMLHPPTPPCLFMMYHIRGLSKIRLKMRYAACLADGTKGYGNGYLSLHLKAFQSLSSTETWQPFSLSISVWAIIFKNIVRRRGKKSTSIPLYWPPQMQW